MGDAIAGGATQLVILGAGYDGRAWRMPELADVKVFEVDHPDTQGDERAHMAELPPEAGVVSFVSIDFERESSTVSSTAPATIARCQPVWLWKASSCISLATRCSLPSLHGSAKVVRAAIIRRWATSRADNALPRDAP